MPTTVKFRYEGERTEDPILGLLTPGCEGAGDEDVVALKIAAGLLIAVDDEGRAAAAAAGARAAQDGAPAPESEPRLPAPRRREPALVDGI
jgi:hypothetical protein